MPIRLPTTRPEANSPTTIPVAPHPHAPHSEWQPFGPHLAFDFCHVLRLSRHQAIAMNFTGIGPMTLRTMNNGSVWLYTADFQLPFHVLALGPNAANLKVRAKSCELAELELVEPCYEPPPVDGFSHLCTAVWQTHPDALHQLAETNHQNCLAFRKGRSPKNLPEVLGQTIWVSHNGQCCFVTEW